MHRLQAFLEVSDRVGYFEDTLKPEHYKELRTGTCFVHNNRLSLLRA